MTTIAPTPPRTGGRPRRRMRSLAAVTLVAVVLGTALVALGPRWVVVGGEITVGEWLARHPTTDSLVAALGGLQSAGNLLLFAPAAVLLALLVAWRWTPLAFLLTALAPVAVEIAQRRLPGRVPDPADVVLNTVGLSLAFATAIVLRAIARVLVGSRWRPAD